MTTTTLITSVESLKPVRPVLAPPPQRFRRPATWKSKLLLSIGATFAILAALEIGFRIFDVFFPKKTQLANPFLLFRGKLYDWSTHLKTPLQVIQPNGRQVLRIVCIGGSTTQDATAFGEQGITYPTALQTVLNEELGTNSGVIVETFNFGIASHSTLHDLIMLETEVLQLNPDLVVVYENINDLLVNYFPGATNPAYANKFLHQFYLPPEFHAEKKCWLDNSRVYSWASRGLRRLFWYQVRYTDEPVELQHAEVFRNNLRNICAIARMHRIPLMFGEQAMVADQELFERHFKTKCYNPDIYYPRIAQFKEHFERYNAIVREVSAEQGVICADPYTLLKNRPELFADVVHVHAEGARIVGREFARTLIESGVFAALIDAKRNTARDAAAAAEARPAIVCDQKTGPR